MNNLVYDRIYIIEKKLASLKIGIMDDTILNDTESRAISYLLPDFLSDNTTRRIRAFQQLQNILLPKTNLTAEDKIEISHLSAQIFSAYETNRGYVFPNYEIQRRHIKFEQEYIRQLQRLINCVSPLFWRILSLLNFNHELNYEKYREQIESEIKSKEKNADTRNTKD